MPISVRRLLFAGCVVIFFIGSFALLFYGQGYRYHIGKWRIEKTGQLLVESRPKGVRVFFDGHSPRKNFFETPTRINGILSGAYTVTLEKDGYFPIQRKVNIEQGKTTFLQDVRMIRTAAPEQIIDSFLPVRLLLFRNGAIVFSTESDIFFLRRPSSISEKAHRILAAQKTKALALSPSRARALAQSTNTIWIFDEGGERRGQFRLPFGIRKVVWGGEDVLFVLSKRGIHRIDLGRGIVTQTIWGNFRDMLFDHELLVIADMPSPALLRIIRDHGDRALAERVAALPHEGLNFLENTKEFIFLSRDVPQPALFAVERQRISPLGVHRLGGRRIARIPGSSNFLTYDESEIFVNRKKNTVLSTEFITRLGARIRTVISIPDAESIAVHGSDGSLSLIGGLNATPYEAPLLSGGVHALYGDDASGRLFFGGELFGKRGVFSSTPIE